LHCSSLYSLSHWILQQGRKIRKFNCN
jgi:hypothetical protein